MFYFRFVTYSLVQTSVWKLLQLFSLQWLTAILELSAATSWYIVFVQLYI